MRSRQRMSGWQFLLSIICAWSMSFTGSSLEASSVKDPVSLSEPPPGKESLEKDSLIIDLFGADEKSSFAAQGLLLAIIKGERSGANPQDQAKAKHYRQFLTALMSPQ